jgi:trehalose/maltose hydrolase-like predicted phosphorylase
LRDSSTPAADDGQWVPASTGDPTWQVTVEEEPMFERVHEAVLTLADGSFGTRGSREENASSGTSLVLSAGLYARHDETEHLMAGPRWTALAMAGDARHGDHRTLDLRRGLLIREVQSSGGTIRIVRFSSLAWPGIMGLRAEGPRGRFGAGPALLPPRNAAAVEHGALDSIAWMSVSSNIGGGTVAAVDQTELDHTTGTRVERIAAYVSDPVTLPPVETAATRLSAARRAGFDHLLDEHVAAWENRWADADITIDGDDDLQRAVRFSLFHLMASVASTGEAAVGARGLSGPNYAGHVFWDADVFVLPFLAATHPAAAQAMLQYRLDRVDAARQEARANGLQGAQFPWESASSGREVTPRAVRQDTGTIEPIDTGTHEEHVVADVAWAAVEYAAWSGDDRFLATDGRRLLAETARFWASRIRRDGHAHIDGVIGPDEYHDVVDDNAYTNVMARWNLRRAAALERRWGTHETEPAEWDDLADAMVDGYDPDTLVFEQFAGFFDLEPLIIGELARPPVAADVLLGRDRVRAAQIIKQPDALMLHHLVPGEVPPASLAPNLDFYLPRTAHGSSLSPAICASLLARAGRPDDALELFATACRMDLDDLTETTAGGLHLATMGGVWQALVYGFAGLRPASDVLAIAPHLPSAWTRLEIRLRYRGARLRIAIGHERIDVTSDATVEINVGGAGIQQVDRAGATFERRENPWERTPL